MRYSRNGQELGSKEVSAESIMPTEHATYKTGAYRMNSIECEREQRAFRMFLALQERERTLTRIGRVGEY